MAPPCYGDLGKKASDLHTKNFHPGMAKFEAKTKTQSGIKLATTGQSNIESGKTFGSMELTYSCSDYGLKYVEKWNTDNLLTIDTSIEDKILKGLKTSFITSYNVTTTKKKGTIKASYKHDYVNLSTDVDLDYAGPTIKGSAVCGYKGWLAGYQVALNASQNKLTANNLTLGYDAGNHVFNAAVNNGSDFGGSYYHKLSSSIEGGLQVGWSSATNSSQASLAAKYSLSPDTSMKVKGAMNGEVGLSLQQKVADCLTLTLSSVLDAKNFFAGGHRVGMCLDFEQ